MSRLLLVLPLIVIAARMQVEWLWFEQFNWEMVLLRRWLLQLISAGVAIVPLSLAWIWFKAFSGCESQSSSANHPGWRFTLLLLLSGIALFVTSF